ncbi:hypothetical protein WH95_06230 [Kiloniella litopenaei]|uniref:Integrase catalytic domain-containing protein n=1 Tax=Kiloniella litopenaei TaxID=1549748 RepID=A0A0M2REJ8_9PROT|nr:DDE-type integrase/transposase/recombinase [Kiloniella litopenaei]KKJ77998.1 hypothetical protein WH95_06230 [Kiloniella litopenaei]
MGIMVPSLTLPKDTEIVFKGQNYTYIKQVKGNIQLERVDTGEVMSLSTRDFVALTQSEELELNQQAWYFDGGIQSKAFDAYSEENKAEALSRYKYIRRLKSKFGPGKYKKSEYKEVLEEFKVEDNLKKPFSVRTLSRWFEAYKNAGEDIRALIPAHSKKGNHTPRLPNKVIDTIDDVIDRIYMRREKASVDRIRAEVFRILAKYNEKVSPAHAVDLPSESTVLRAIQRRDPYTVCVHKFDEAEANRRFKQYYASTPVSRPMQCVQMDHTQMDVVALIGKGLTARPWLTVALDQYTRMVVGYYISLDKPSFSSVGKCLADIIDPNGLVPTYNPPEMLLLDNGAEFHSQEMVEASFQMNCVIKYCEAGDPVQKAHVERIFRTLNTMFLHQIKGTTFGDTKAREGYDSIKEASLTLNELEAMTKTFFTKIYPSEWHGGISCKPLELWNESVEQGMSGYLNLGTEFKYKLMRKVARTVQPYGIEVFGLKYNMPDLGYYRANCLQGHEFEIRYDPDDLSEVFLKDPDNGRFVSVPACDQEYTRGLKAYQHRLITSKRAANKTKNKNCVDRLSRKAEFFEGQNWDASKKRGYLQAGSSNPDKLIKEAQKNIPASSNGFDDIYSSNKFASEFGFSENISVSNKTLNSEENEFNFSVNYENYLNKYKIEK